MSRVAVGFGSNLGDRIGNLRRARAALATFAPVQRASSVWETAPVGGPPQPAYLNAVVLVDWDAPIDGLLARLVEIERSLGRVRNERWGPRTIDLDILLADGVAVATPGLTVPHPRLAERAFALVPLLEVWTDAADPTTGVRYAELELDRRGVARTALALA